MKFVSKTCFSVFVLATLSACGGGGGGASKSFAVLSSIQGEYYGTEFDCTADTKLSDLNPDDVWVEIQDIGTLTISQSKIVSRIDGVLADCVITVDAKILNATDKQVKTARATVSFAGAGCAAVPEQVKNQIRNEEELVKAETVQYEILGQILKVVDSDNECVLMYKKN
jgi:hypothetical protein